MKLTTCCGCGTPLPATDLLTKQVRWRESGPTGKVTLSKNIGRYCPACVNADVQYQQLRESK